MDCDNEPMDSTPASPQQPASVKTPPPVEERVKTEFTDDESTTINKEPKLNPVAPATRCSLHVETVNKLLAHSIGIITLDCGYHQAHQSSLDILSDVCCDYIRKISSLLRLAVDTEDWRDPECDFVDSLERVFHQVNIPSAANLHQFVCKMEAIKRHDRKSC